MKKKLQVIGKQIVLIIFALAVIGLKQFFPENWLAHAVYAAGLTFGIVSFYCHKRQVLKKERERSSEKGYGLGLYMAFGIFFLVQFKGCNFLDLSLITIGALISVFSVINWLIRRTEKVQDLIAFFLLALSFVGLNCLRLAEEWASAEVWALTTAYLTALVCSAFFCRYLFRQKRILLYFFCCALLGSFLSTIVIPLEPYCSVWWLMGGMILVLILLFRFFILAKRT